MKKQTIRKILFGCFAVIIVGAIFFTYYHIKGKTPEYTLTVFKTTYGKNSYLQFIKLEDDSDSITNGDFYLVYGIIEGNDFPKNYDWYKCCLHIIPEDSIYKIESQWCGWYGIVNNELNDVVFYIDTTWHLAGYSNDDNLYDAKILKYYFENKDKMKTIVFRDDEDKEHKYRLLIRTGKLFSDENQLEDLYREKTDLKYNGISKKPSFIMKIVYFIESFF